MEEDPKQIKEQEVELIRSLKEGDKEAFAIFFNRYKDKLYGFLVGIIRSEDKADDLVQDLFLKVWQNREMLANVDNLNAYLYSIAKNLAFDNLRRFSKETLIMEELSKLDETAVDPTPADILMQKELGERIAAAVKKLPPQQQKVYMLRKEKGLQHEEIAQLLDLSVSTIKNHMKRAVGNLRRIISYSYPDLLIFWFIFLFPLFLD